MLYLLIILAIGLLVLSAAPQWGDCNHEFIAAERQDFGGHFELVYRCERCGVALDGHA